MLTLEILIPIAWLIVVALVVAMCSISARGDSELRTNQAQAGWVKVGPLGLRGGALGTRAGGESEWGETPEALVRELSGV